MRSGRSAPVLTQGRTSSSAATGSHGGHAGAPASEASRADLRVCSPQSRPACVTSRQRTLPPGTIRTGVTRGPRVPPLRAAEVPLTRRALITGITGQDGSYLAEHLLARWAMRSGGWSAGRPTRGCRGLRELLADVRLVRGDLLDQGSLISAVERVQPDEVYNLAAISYVPMSWQQAELTGEVTGLGRAAGARGDPGVQRDQRVPQRRDGGQIRFYQASIVGDVRPGAASRRRPRGPRSTRAARTAWPRCTGTS